METLKDMRMRHKLTLVGAAKLIGIKAPSLYRIEKGLQFMKASTIETIATAYGVTEIDVFAAWTDNKNQSEKQANRQIT